MESGLDTSKLTDRELLLILHERVNEVRLDVRELKEGTSGKIIALEAQDAARERQINRLTNYMWFAWGVLAAAEVGLAIYLKLSK